MLLRLLFVVLPVVLCAPIQNDSGIDGKFAALQKQLDLLQQQIHEQRVEMVEPQMMDDYYAPEDPAIWRSRSLPQRQMEKRLVYWQPMKRAVYWQPVKKSIQIEKEEVLRMLAERLTDVIRAGEVMGVSSDELLAHLRARNGAQKP